MQLVVDVGNTFIKIGLFEKEVLKFHDSFLQEDFNREVQPILRKYDIKKAIISSVGNLSEENKNFLMKSVECVTLNQFSKIPFKNLYATPHTLGADRIALMAAAVEKFSLKNVLVIDAGTCITYDFVNVNSEYLGGAISPGIETRYKSLHDYTANLPFLEKQIPENFIGNSTQMSIHSGIINGIVQELDGIIFQYSDRYGKLTVVLTGGDAEFLAKQLKSIIFVRPFFLLEGLNTILNINNPNKNLFC